MIWDPLSTISMWDHNTDTRDRCNKGNEGNPFEKCDSSSAENVLVYLDGLPKSLRSKNSVKMGINTNFCDIYFFGRSSGYPAKTGVTTELLETAKNQGARQTYNFEHQLSLSTKK